MTENQALNLKEFDRVVDNRDGVKATVIGVNADIIRVRYDDELSSNYLRPSDCEHLEKVGKSEAANG